MLKGLLILALLQQPPSPAAEEPQDELEIEETVVVTATRTDRRIEDEPTRVEVVPQDEVQEKIMMAPGDVSMLLNETNGLRVQTTSPSLGSANVRIQGLRGRYTQILADGLPLYGGQTGSIGILQIPPMDLRQVEVIKGVASALYGVSAIGGVVNLVSRRPTGEPAREILINRTSHDGTDGVLWLAAPIDERWGYTLLAGGHWQERSDLDQDGWTDLPVYRRMVLRPRLFWENGAGASLLVAGGYTDEGRRGGTMPGAVTPAGTPYDEGLGTRRVDAGSVARMVVGGGRLLTLRGSMTRTRHEHVFGPSPEEDVHRTFFAEASLTGSRAAHTWVLGTAWQRDDFQSADVPRFDYAYTAPGVFAQDDVELGSRVTLSGSLRADFHNEYGTFVSPRVAALIRAGGPWTMRVSAGRGYFAPSPFTEETEASGLRPLAPLGELEPERADSVSGDLTWTRDGFEITGTVFYSHIRDAIDVEETAGAEMPLQIVNAPGPTNTRGTEFIARYHTGALDVIATHMFVWSTEWVRDGAVSVQREVALNPRHSAGLDILWQLGPARTGIELFYTGRQALEDNPYRTEGAPYLLWGALLDWRFSARLRGYVNAENLGDVRQTKTERLIRPEPRPDGRWDVDAWAPLEGRTINAGVRISF